MSILYVKTYSDGLVEWDSVTPIEFLNSIGIVVSTGFTERLYDKVDDLKVLCELGEALDEIDDGANPRVLDAVMELYVATEISTLKNIIDIIQLRSYYLYNGVADDEDLGKAIYGNAIDDISDNHWAYPFSLDWYINYSKLGEDYRSNVGGGHTSYGYLEIK